MIRGFSLKGLSKWLKGAKAVNLDKVTDNVIIENLGEMRTLSIALQQHVLLNIIVDSWSLSKFVRKIEIT